ncbi:camphor resistance protein CrcB [Mycobacterium sp. Soil538]|nr:camphor resistance protein CrcB [Mycobacterium sp. Soil538]
MSGMLWSGVAVMGGLGAMARFVIDRGVAKRVARPFPFGTLTVNLTGATLLGFLSGLTLSHPTALLVSTGFVGAYTTFSTWMFETHRLAEERQYLPAVANIVVSVLAGVTAAAVGQWIAHGVS